MEILIVVVGTLIVPFAIVIGLKFSHRKMAEHKREDDKLINTLETLVEQKSGVIKLLREKNNF